MNKEQKEIFNSIIARWHVPSSDGLTVQQAALDIGFLTGVILRLEYKNKPKPSAN